MNSMLQHIVNYKREEIALAKKRLSIKDLLAIPRLNPRNFLEALYSESTPGLIGHRERSEGSPKGGSVPGSEIPHCIRDDVLFSTRNELLPPAIIAEIKKASPSKGVIRTDFDVAQIAKVYEQNKARCLSVLTDFPSFQGLPENISIAKKNCSLPILRKDFILDSYQIYESAALGADCILLIVAMLDDHQLLDFCQLAQELKLDVLVESHNLEELNRALPLPTPLMGINNRNLHTFETDIQLSIQLKSHIPAEKMIITESGINSLEDKHLMQNHGINTFLIGEYFMKAKDIGARVKDFIEN